jgi:predicted lipid-binding transport protein (Tim44 family)
VNLLASIVLTRAGGGHNFGGGGGGGGRVSGGGGGGGGIFVGGGGGGGGGGGIIGLIVFVVIIIVIVAVLKSRFSGRTSKFVDEPLPPAPGGNPADSSPFRGQTLPGTHGDAHVGSAEEGIAAIKAHDPAFAEDAFLSEVQRAFFVVQQAWTELKPEESRRVMADGLWQQHKVQIEQYINEHKRNVLEDLSVGDANIINAHSDQTYDTITVRFLAACADYDINTDNNKIVRGDKHVGQWQEDWLFQRSSSATTKADGGTLAQRCPNCGAPLDVDLAGECKYCKAPIMGGKYDWVLARIAQV